MYGNGWVDYYDEENLALYTEWVGKIDPAYGMNAYAQTGWATRSSMLRSSSTSSQPPSPSVVILDRFITWVPARLPLE